MKNKFLISMLFVPALSLAQSLEGEFVRTPFWEVPFKSSLQIEAKTENVERLEKVCKLYSRKVENALVTGNTSFLKRHIESLRTQPHLDDWQVSSFEEVFVIKLEDLEFSNQSGDYGPSPSSLPFYKHIESFQYVDYDQFEKLEYSSDDDSLSSISEKIGLELKKPQFTFRHSKGVEIKVFSKDLACDMLNKKIALVGSVNSEVRPVKEETTKLEKFYQFNFMKEFSAILKLPTSDRKKAFLMGYRLGNLLAQNTIINEREVVEKDFINLMQNLLKEESLTPSQMLSENSGQYWINQTLYHKDVKLHLSIR